MKAVSSVYYHIQERVHEKFKSKEFNPETQNYE